MRDLALGLLITLIWGVLQFATAYTAGWIHVLLIAGVLLIIRGIALAPAGKPS